MHKIKARRSSSMKSLISYIPHSIGPYILDKEIGSGSFSVVYRAFLKKTKKEISPINQFSEEEQVNDNGNSNKYHPISNNKKIYEMNPALTFSRSKSFCLFKKDPISNYYKDDSSKLQLDGSLHNLLSTNNNEDHSEQSLNDDSLLKENSNRICGKARIYAIKIYPKSNLESQSDEELFQREINAMAFLHHENIISLKDILSDDYNFYLVMDYCKGFDLKQYITENASDGIDEKTAANIFKQIISAVSYCHSMGVAHRDLKPENILITSYPNIKISDFGLCGYITEDQLMRTFCGSPCYAAPECLSKIEYDGIRADIWSLGVLLYTIVTGGPPWPVNNSSIMFKNIIKGKYTIPKSISQPCKSLITGMLNINPKERLTMDQIINHPWIIQNAINQNEDENEEKEANNLLDSNTAFSENNDNFINSIVKSYQLTTSKSMTLAEFSAASSKLNKFEDHGIYYPFTYVADKYVNSSGQEYDNNEEENENFDFLYDNNDDISSDCKDEDDNFFPPKSDKSFTTDCDSSNFLDSSQNQNSDFPIIKKQKKKPRRSDLSTNMTLYSPRNSSLITSSSDDHDISQKSKTTNNQKIQKEAKKEKSKIPTAPMNKKRQESVFTKINPNVGKQQSQKILKFPKRSKSHLNFV